MTIPSNAGGTLQETHFAVVTNNKDPEKRGRLKLKCQSLVGANTELPDWAEPCATMFTTMGGGSLFLPLIGSTVEIIVDVHDVGLDEMAGEKFLQNPNIKWRSVGFTGKGGVMPLPAALQTNYPNRRGFVTPAGHSVVMDD